MLLPPLYYSQVDEKVGFAVFAVIPTNPGSGSGSGAGIQYFRVFWTLLRGSDDRIAFFSNLLMTELTSASDPVS